MDDDSLINPKMLQQLDGEWTNSKPAFIPPVDYERHQRPGVKGSRALRMNHPNACRRNATD